MEDFVARDDLLSASQLNTLCRKSDVRAAAQLASHFLLLMGTGYLVWLGSGGWRVLPAMVVHGIAVAFLFCAHHEFIHRTPFRARWLNDAAAKVTGFLVFYPAFYFRLYHFAHHRHTQDPARDPELAAPPPATRRAYLWWIMGLPYWRHRFGTSLKHAVTGRVPDPFVRRRDVSACVTEARWMWSLYLLVAAVSIWLETPAALVYWLAPLLIGQPFLRLYLMAEHTGCANSPDMLKNTRTMLTNPLIRRLAWNMPFHTEHHIFPGVPFYGLPGVHRLVRDRLRTVVPGYIAAHREIWRGLGRRAA